MKEPGPDGPACPTIVASPRRAVLTEKRSGWGDREATGRRHFTSAFASDCSASDRRMTILGTSRALAAACALAVAAGCAGEPADDPIEVQEPEPFDPLAPVAISEPPPGTDSSLLEVGRQAYLVCAVCHGFDGSGTPLGPSLRDGTWIHISGSPAEIATIIRTGVAEPLEHPVPMPVMGGGRFTSEELNGLVAYVHALSRS